jgi:hypothetical protein
LADEKVFKAGIVDINTGELRKFQYNPETLKDDRFVTIASIAVPGLNTPRYQFVAGGDTTVSFSLFLNALNHPKGGQGILDDIIWLRSRTFPTRSSNVLQVAPSKVMLVWPGLYNVKGILTTCNLEYTAFFPDGKPKHCNISIEIKKEYI